MLKQVIQWIPDFSSYLGKCKFKVRIIGGNLNCLTGDENVGLVRIIGSFRRKTNDSKNRDTNVKEF